MKAPAISIATLIFLLFSEGIPGADQEGKPQPQSPAPSLQQQIDALKENQQRILQELEEIKKLLQERPAKVEYAAKPAPVSVVRMNVHGEPFKGDARAKIVVMEYSEFDCSFCARYAREIYPLIERDYIKSGKIRYYFRDFPPPENPYSLTAARAARCSGEQGKFWEMHDRLFAEQGSPSGRDFAGHAQALGLDLEKFGACLASDKYAENIRRSVLTAQRDGIYGTPGFLVGTLSDDGDFVTSTKVFVGAESYETFKPILDELLAAPGK